MIFLALALTAAPSVVALALSVVSVLRAWIRSRAWDGLEV